ncbi:MAG TPA: NAD+ synthase [Thermoplasmata archaeon]|nr:NAD+ synthase [Thermoplasmata archaeon]
MTDLVPKLPAHAEATIHRFLRAHAGGPRDGVVLGLSGGIDSALCARLARDALGADHVLGALLPDAAYPAPLRAETEAFADALGIDHVTIPIAPIEAAYRAELADLTDRVDVGNLKARIRMGIWYALARPRRRLVLGTGNKSELLLGYFTKYGDGGVDLLPIGDLYKTEVRELARRLELPAPILARPPTAGLWEGQTDEEELGLPYAALDRILTGLEQLLPEREIAARTGLPPEVVRGVVARVEGSRHKRRMPPIPKLALRTVGLDWRE